MTEEWKITGTRVHGQGQSYNCINKATAQQLQLTLNQYEKTIKTLEKQNELNKHFKIIIMDLKILKQDMETLKEKL